MSEATWCSSSVQSLLEAEFRIKLTIIQVYYVFSIKKHINLMITWWWPEHEQKHIDKNINGIWGKHILHWLYLYLQMLHFCSHLSCRQIASFQANTYMNVDEMATGISSQECRQLASAVYLWNRAREGETFIRTNQNDSSVTGQQSSPNGRNNSIQLYGHMGRNIDDHIYVSHIWCWKQLQQPIAEKEKEIW